MMRPREGVIKGFTLMELLVVMAIISLLAGIMVPVMGKAKEAAKKNHIRDQSSQLKAAWELSFTELKILPAESWVTMEKDAVEYLHGDNSMGYIYMDFSKDALENSDGMVDKYEGKPYHIALDNGLSNDDAAYDGKVKYGSGYLQTHVAVWHDWKLEGGDTSDDIRSWKEF